MKAKYLLVAAMGLLLGLSTSASAHSAVQSADIFAAAFPAGTEPVVDGDLGEWEWIRESNLRNVYTLSARDFNYQARGGNPDGLTENFFPAGDNTNLDDFNFNMTLGYTPGTNMLYLGIEIFDNDHVRWAATDQLWQEDGFNMWMDPDHDDEFGGTSVPPRELQQILFAPQKLDGENVNIESDGVAWQVAHDELICADPGSCHDNRIFDVAFTNDGPVFGETTTFIEAWVELYNYLDPDESLHASDSDPHIMNPEGVIGFNIYFQDMDTIDGEIAYTNRYYNSENANGQEFLADVFLAPVEADVPTAVESTTWGRIKAGNVN